MKLDNKGDVGLIEDLVFALKNLVAAEEHAIGSYSMNQENPEGNKWIEVAEKVRDIRSRWMQLLVKKENSQLWCESKHLLSSIMGLIEVGNRFNNQGLTNEAKTAYNDSIDLTKLLLVLNDVDLKGGKNE